MHYDAADGIKLFITELGVKVFIEGLDRLPEDILHIFSLIHVTSYHGCRHMVPLFSLSNTMYVMSLYIHNIYQRLCEAGYLLNCGLD